MDFYFAVLIARQTPGDAARGPADAYSSTVQGSWLVPDIGPLHPISPEISPVEMRSTEETRFWAEADSSGVLDPTRELRHPREHLGPRDGTREAQIV